MGPFPFFALISFFCRLRFPVLTQSWPKHVSAFNHMLLGEESKITNIARGKGKLYSKNCMESFYCFHEEENLYSWNPYISLSWRKKTGVVFDWINTDVSGDLRGIKWWEIKLFEFDQVMSARERVHVIAIQSRSVNGPYYWMILLPCLNCGRSVLIVNEFSQFIKKMGSNFWVWTKGNYGFCCYVQKYL